MTCLMPYPGHELLLPHAARAENNYVFDSAGKKYVDLEAGVWCMALGHGRPEILDIIRDQYSRIIHAGFCYSSQIVEQAAADILALHGFDGGRLVFLSSGSEAVEYGVMVARMLFPQSRMMTMADSYFGAYGSAKEKNPDQWFTMDWTSCAACPLDKSCASDCPHFARIPFPELGGFLFEPGSSGGLVRFPPQKLIRAIAAQIRENKGLVMVNEVTTGMGRTGKFFGYQHYELSPDMVIMGKGLGNGYPVSATAFNPHVIERLENRPVLYAQSHMNDPLGAAIAKEVLRIIRQENLVERGRQMGVRLRDGLDEIKTRTGKIREIRSRGLMLAIELKDDSKAAQTTRLHRALFENGYITARRPGLPVFRIDPCLTVAKEDVNGFLQTFSRLL